VLGKNSANGRGLPMNKPGGCLSRKYTEKLTAKGKDSSCSFEFKKGRGSQTTKGIKKSET